MSLMYSSKMEMMVDDKHWASQAAVTVFRRTGLKWDLPKHSISANFISLAQSWQPASIVKFPYHYSALQRTPGGIGYIYSRYIKVSHW